MEAALGKHAGERATLLLVCAAFVFYDLVTFREVMVRQFAGQAEIIGSNSAWALLFDDVDVATATLAALRAGSASSSLPGFTV